MGVLHEGQGALGIAAAAGPGVNGVGQAVQVEGAGEGDPQGQDQSAGQERGNTAHQPGAGGEEPSQDEADQGVVEEGAA